MGTGGPSISLAGVMVPSDELDDLRRSPTSRRVLIAAIVVLVGVGLALTLRPVPKSERAGAARLSFDLELLDGSGRLTANDLRGKPVVVNFFASWCLPCREEAPLLQATYERFRDQGVVFLGVNIRDTPSAARDFVDRFDITYPVVRDPEQNLATQLEVLGLPVTYFVDRSGYLMGSGSGEQIGATNGTQVLGAISEEDLVAGIEGLLEAEGSP